MSLLNHYRTYPQLSLCSLLLLALGLIGATFYLYNADQNQQANIDRYGQIIASSTARQAVDATLNQDMVSLQAILQEVAQYPNVIGVTLRNLDNKLLVQSGYKPNQPVQGKRYNFTAPVALHNNVAGYLEVTLEIPRRTSHDAWFLLFWATSVTGSLLIIWWSIHRRWWSALRDKMPSADQIVTAVVEKIPTIAEPSVEPEPVALPPAQVSVRLSLHLLNLTKLHQQLNSEGFNSVLRRFEKQLQGLLSLYNGQRQSLAGETLFIDFSGEEFHECSFRAVCCAHILINMANQNPSPRLQLSAGIKPLAAPTQSAGCALVKEFLVNYNNSLTPGKNEILVSGNLLDTQLQHHAEFDLGSGKLTSIKAPYSDYVNKQQEQLLLHQ
ncbi:MAG: hypothetical protein EOO52_18975 [Gammaproteobacteria bacterium]|nr:MAG: hypothetical protein EOO52_18975 [Gammaproteobacteria bacterium]